MPTHQIELALWVSQPLVHMALAAVVLRRKLHRQFPAFFTYIVAQIAVFSLEFPVYWLVRNSGQLYFTLYWSAEALNVVLAFKIIHEVFLDVFRPYPALKDLGTALFKWAALIMVLVSVVLISLSPGWDDPVSKTILVVQRCVSVVQCGLVIFLLAFCKNLGVSWRRQSFGVALGFGVFSGAQLLMFALYSGSHVHGVTANVIQMGAYSAAMLLWLCYSLSNRPQEVVVPVLVPQRWDDALMDIHSHSETESLIPMFEHMVERAFSRAQDAHLN